MRRNIRRFPPDFMFQMTKEDIEEWKSQIVISNSIKMGLRKPPYAFSLFGVAQLEAINTAIAELQVEHRKQPKRKPIGFILPKEDEGEIV